MRRHRGASRRGVTLVEMMVALAVFSLVMAGALQFLSSQGKAVRLGNERMGALQNVQFAMSMLDDQLRTAGGGVVDKQPFLIYAGTNVVAFNVDYATNVANDLFSAFYDPDAPNGTVSAMTTSQQITVPNTSFAYPAVNYPTSPAETLIFFFAPDTTTSRTDDVILYRQVNAETPELVARNILSDPSTPFFRYVRLYAPDAAPAYADTVPSTRIPLAHTVSEHLSPADTGSEAIIDSIRAVRVTLTVTDGNTGTAEHRRTLSRLISLPNAGLLTGHSCGDEPILGTTLTAALEAPASGDTLVRLSWGAAVDEGGGEKDVLRYVLWRRTVGNPEWGDPYLSIPAGSAPYSYPDGSIQHGLTYEYALAAQDCSPAFSSQVTSSQVYVP